MKLLSFLLFLCDHIKKTFPRDLKLRQIFNSFLFPNYGIEDRSLTSNSLDCCCCVIKFDPPSCFLPVKNLSPKKGLVLKLYPPPKPPPPLGRNERSAPNIEQKLSICCICNFQRRIFISVFGLMETQGINFTA